MPDKNTIPRVQFIYLDGKPVFAYMPLIEYVRLLEKANGALEEQVRQGHEQRTYCPPNIHPGEVLETEFLDPAGCSWGKLSRKTGLPRRVIRELVFGQRPVTPKIAARLARFFGTEPEFWLGLQADYDAEQALRAQGEGGGA